MSDSSPVSQQKEALRLSNKESNELTRICIETSLILLMKTKRFEDISITEIVKRAGVSRTAYYRNYDSKENILHSIMQEIGKHVIANIDLRMPIINTYAYWRCLFSTLQQYEEHLEVLFKAGMGEQILNQIYLKMLRSIEEESTTTQVSLTQLQEKMYKSHFWSGAIYGITSAWVRNGCTESPDEMAGCAYQIVTNIGKECAP